MLCQSASNGLQHRGRLGRARCRILYFAFDLINLEGKSLLSMPLVERKHILEAILSNAPPSVRFAGFLEGEPEAIFAAVREHNLEGIVAKLASSRYEPDRRSGAWVKVKVGHHEEFVVGGYTRGKGSRQPFGALIVGYYDNKGTLRYASKVGTGFSDLQIGQILTQTAGLVQEQCPFESIPESGVTSWNNYGLTDAERRTAVWLKPMLVCRVRFTEWTADGHLRHPCFEGFCISHS
jgi:bifunctional non-homologous end joining protein LigD